VDGGVAAGLADARVEAEVADERVRWGEEAEVADRGDDRERDGRIDARRSSSADSPRGSPSRSYRFVERRSVEALLRQLDFYAEELRLIETDLARVTLARAMQDHLHPVLQSSALPDEMRPACDRAVRV